MNRKHHTVVVINVLRSSDERDIDVLSHTHIYIYIRNQYICITTTVKPLKPMIFHDVLMCMIFMVVRLLFMKGSVDQFSN